MDEFDRMKAQKNEILARQASKPSAREEGLERALRFYADERNFLFMDDYGLLELGDSNIYLQGTNKIGHVARLALQPSADGEETNG